MFKPTDLIRLSPSMSSIPMMGTCVFYRDDHVGDLKTGEIGLVLQVQVIDEFNSSPYRKYRILKGGISGWIRGELIEKV
jgi:hypothetical protein